MKKIFLLILFIPGMLFGGWTQTIIYSENFGTGLLLPAGWTVTNGLNTWTPSVGSPSSGYAGASGGTNVVATNGSSLNTYYLTYANNLSTIGYTTITLIWGARRTSTFSNGVTFEWSSDGNTWNQVPYTQVNANSTWSLVNVGTVIYLPPAAEGIANLCLRWSYTQITGSGTYRIDDLTVQGILLSPVVTYTWQGPDGGDWSFPANWNPPRTVPASTDILQFDDGKSNIINNVITQTIGQLSVLNFTSITLQSSGPSVLTIGGTGNNFVVSENSRFNINGPDALTVSLINGVTGAINGGVTFSGGGHKFLAADANSLVFAPSGVFTAGTGFSGNPFGTSNLNSVIFQAGSAYISQSGSNPFGAAAPNSVVVFQPGSFYTHQQSGSLSLSGRTYGNFELNYPSTFTQSGSSPVSIGKLTITAGTLNFNLTGPSTGTHSIKGNITIANGQALNFNPSSTGNVTFDGTNGQLLSGDGTITNSGNSTFIVNNGFGVTNALNNSLTLNGNLNIIGGPFIINPGKSMVLNGSLTNNLSEGLQVRSDATGTGSFLAGNTINGTGTVKIERLIPSWTSNTDGWHFLSSPVLNQPIEPNFIDPVPANYDFYKWDEPTMTWLNQKVSTNNMITFTGGEGYLVSYANTMVKDFAGIPNNSDLLFNNLSFTNVNPNFYGWHLLGNPFSCALHWNDGNWGLNHVSGIAKILNSGGTYSDIGPGGTIPSMNGFLVQVTGASNTITIPKNSRVIDNGTSWYKSTTADSDKLILRASSNEDNTYAECVIKFDLKSTTGYDQEYDSHFLEGLEGTPRMYSIIKNDTFLSTNTLPPVPENKTIQIGFKKGISGTYTLNISGIETFGEGNALLLEDLQTGQTQDLTQHPIYVFSSDDMDNSRRFLLHFGSLFSEGKQKKNEQLIIYAAGKSIYIKVTEGYILRGKLLIYNLQGQELLMKPLDDKFLNIVRWDGIHGYYIARVFTDNEVATEKLFIGDY